VDDPWTYGAIAAANAMSDVYAMGGDVLFALNIAGIPSEMDPETVAQIFAGAAYKVREAGAAIAGGHTLTNPEPFFGLSVTGIAHPGAIMRKGGAQPGDLLFLTKPLGTGIITTAAKRTGSGETSVQRLARRTQGKPDLQPKHFDTAVDSMLLLNRAAAQAAKAAGVRAATDITGYGLLGHGSEMAAAAWRESRAGFVIHAASVPAFEGIWDYIAAGYLTSGSTRNPAHYGINVTFAPEVTPAQRTLLWEVETSGGLLLAVPAAAVDAFTGACHERKQAYWHVGEVVKAEGIQVV
jgi:selenide,water dikinase